MTQQLRTIVTIKNKSHNARVDEISKGIGLLELLAEDGAIWIERGQWVGRASDGTIVALGPVRTQLRGSRLPRVTFNTGGMVIDSKSLYAAIRPAIDNVIDRRSIDPSSLRKLFISDELSRNAAQAVVSMLDALEIENACPICGHDARPEAPLINSALNAALAWAAADHVAAERTARIARIELAISNSEHPVPVTLLADREAAVTSLRDACKSERAAEVLMQDAARRLLKGDSADGAL